MRSVCATAGLLVALCACSDRSNTPAAVYGVRAKVAEVTGSGADLRVVAVHEAIPAFKGRDGEVAEMPAMRMAFGVDPKLDSRGLKPGSQWELTFAVRWNQEPVLLITSAKPLPADVALAIDSAH